MIRKSPLRRKSRLSPVSPKRAKELKEYRVRRAAFLAAHPWCQVWLAENGVTEDDVNPKGVAVIKEAFSIRCCGSVPRSEEIHHRKHREGKRLNDEQYWMACSRQGHRAIHANPALAYKMGWLLR